MLKAKVKQAGRGRVGGDGHKAYDSLAEQRRRNSTACVINHGFVYSEHGSRSGISIASFCSLHSLLLPSFPASVP
jgi:hypothetical protein